jgi:hypothetical protein
MESGAAGITTTSPNGNTVTVKLAGLPVQVNPFSLYAGVTVIVPEIAPLNVLVAAKLIVSVPGSVMMPELPKPISVLLFVQLAPVSVPVKLIGPTGVPGMTI